MPDTSERKQARHAGHNHDHHHRGDMGRLAWALALAVAYMVAEVVGGWLTGSLALLADAGHMLSDAAALALSLFALWVARRPPTPRRSYGYYRAEILAALANGATLVAVSGYVLVEAYRRVWESPDVQGVPMMAVALGGLLVNLAGLWLLHGGRSGSLNVRGAWLHLLGDALGSVAALAGGALVWAFGWLWADPAASALIALLVAYSSWALLREAVAVLMEDAPGHLDVGRVREVIAGVAGVEGVHDLHVWSITSGMVSLSAHIVVRTDSPPHDVLGGVRRVLHERFGIDHATIQVEPPNFEEQATPF